MRKNLTFRTQGFAAFSVRYLYSCHYQRTNDEKVEFNPFIENSVAVVSGSNFGIVGAGQLWVLKTDELNGKVYIEGM